MCLERQITRVQKGKIKLDQKGKIIRFQKGKLIHVQKGKIIILERQDICRKNLKIGKKNRRKIKRTYRPGFKTKRKTYFYEDKG